LKRTSGWFVPVAVVVTCIPCLLVPIVSALVAAGAFGGPLGLEGVPWVLALLSAVAAGAGMLFFRLRRHRSDRCKAQTMSELVNDFGALLFGEGGQIQREVLLAWLPEGKPEHRRRS